MTKLIGVFSLTLTIMASCGQKGPLYLPDAQAKIQYTSHPTLIYSRH